MSLQAANKKNIFNRKIVKHEALKKEIVMLKK